MSSSPRSSPRNRPPIRRVSPPSRRNRRGGGVLIYSVAGMTALLGVGSLAVDLGHVQAVKTDIQRCADATARGHLSLYQVYGRTTAAATGALLPGQNPVDSGSGVAPTVTVTWGRWNFNTGTFTAGTFDPPAVQVTVSRRAANGNGVPLVLGSLFGRATCDVSVTSVAALGGSTSSGVAVSGQHDPWLAGMPAGSTASYSDTAPAQSPYQVVSVPVVPGTYMTFTNVSGGVRNGPSQATADPDGNTGQILNHGSDSPGGPTPAAENGIADVVMPINAVLGVFLDDSRPDTTAAPARRDYSTSSSRNRALYDDILLKQPFFVGDGETSGGNVQQFKVPAGATRLYLGVMDGYEWANNGGSVSATVTVSQTIQIVK